jgi:tripartite-type tricarboxylate transporter receptor subunit TctC
MAMFGLMKRLLRIGGMAMVGLATAGVHAQGFPAKPLRWIVGYPAGGGSDNAVRILAARLAEKLGQPVIVENHPGAATIVAAETAAKSAPDGYTLFSVDNGSVVFNPLLYKKLPYDPSRDFAPVALYGKFPLLLVVNPQVVPADSVASLVRLAKAAGGSMGYASPGLGSPQHLAGELFKEMTGAPLLHVPYKGTAPLTQDLLGGHIGVSFIGVPTGMRQVQAGKLRALGVAEASRLPSLPEIPTLAEAGAGDIVAYAWQGVVVPAGTPAATVDRLSAALQAIVKSPDVQARLREIGVEPMEGGKADMAALTAGDLKRWGDVIRKRGITLEQ